MSFPFSPAGYGQLLGHLAKHHYETVTFTQLPRVAEAGSCVLRHDVDASLDMARRLAEVEAEHGVRSTYFVMLRSPLYNVLSRQGGADVRRLIALGHEVGLHFDSRDGNQDDDVPALIARDLAAISEVTGTSAGAFSFHQPTPELIARRVAVPGAENAYTLEERGYRYASDSNRNWRGSNIAEIIEQRQPIQILLHPMWWVCDAPDVHDCWDIAIQENFARQQQHLMTTEGAYGPERRLLLTRRGRDAGTPADSTAAGRAYLAALTDADVPVLFSWINDRALAVQSAPFHPVHQADHEEWFRNLRARRDVVIFGIRRAGDDRLVGSCQLHGINHIHRSAELQIRIGVAEARGAGIGTDACRALLKHAFEDLNLTRVFLHVLASNTAAKRLYEKVGFEVEGIARQAVFIDGQWHDVVTMARRLDAPPSAH